MVGTKSTFDSRSLYASSNAPQTANRSSGTRIAPKMASERFMSAIVYSFLTYKKRPGSVPPEHIQGSTIISLGWRLPDHLGPTSFHLRGTTHGRCAEGPPAQRNRCVIRQPNASLLHHEFTNIDCSISSVPEAFHPHFWSFLRKMWTGFVSVALVLRRLYWLCDGATDVIRMAFR